MSFPSLPNDCYMKYAVASEHRDFYQKQHAIEFESLLSSEHLRQLIAADDTVLAERLGVKPEDVKNQASHKLFMAGRDIWRSDEYLKRFIVHSHLSEIASELIEQKPLRLGYVQFFPGPPRRLNPHSQPDPYAQFLQHQHSLKEVSCLQTVLCGLMLCLSSFGTEPEENRKGFNIVEANTASLDQATVQPVSVFCKKAGNGIFFTPDVPIDFQQLWEHPGQTYLMIVYTHFVTQYILNENDPHGHALKRLGYVFGDRLSDKLNPIVHR